MENEREKSRDEKEGSGQQQPLGQQNDNSAGQSGQGSEAQDDTTLAGRADQQDLGQDQPGSFAGGLSGRQAEPQGEGFVGSEGQDSGEYLQQGGTPESGFAEQGRGASNQGSDIERDAERSQDRDSDIEGSSDRSS